MEILEILKWVGIVLAAGFIGYFGRYLAMLIIERVHKRKAQETSSAGPAMEPAPQFTPEMAQLEIEKEKAKAEKKRAKAEAKRLKKAQKE
jgi:hypothetical protein